MAKADRLFIIIPAYNEEETIRTIVEEWYPVVVMVGKESRLVIIDDGSKDGTLAALEQEKKDRPQLIVKHKENSGHGPTILWGYHYALKAGADYVFQTDSDGQTRPEEFSAFWRCRSRFDMVVGYRNHREDGLSRIFVTKVLKAVIFLCFHTFVKDANTPYRLMNAETLAEEIKFVPKDFFLTNVVLAVAYTKHKRRVRFIPITFRPRQGGVNSINMKRIIKIGKNAVFDFIKINKRL